MIQRLQPATPALTAVDVAQRFGPIPLHRIRFDRYPGTEQDVIDIDAHEDRLCELVDGILVEKTMGFRESMLACFLSRIIGNWVAPQRLGRVAGEGGMMRLAPGLVRIPDVSFVARDQFPSNALSQPIPDLAPTLAVEVLSESNTRKEMSQKLQEYFAAGTKLVWYVDPKTRTVDVFTAVDRCVRLTEQETLDGGEVLPGFTLPLKELFAELDDVAETAG
jgi:Uma2 family endonuclease